MEIKLEVTAAITGDDVTLTPKAGGMRAPRTPDDIVVGYGANELDTSLFVEDGVYEVVIRRK